MRRNNLKISEDGIITFSGFDQIKDDHMLTVKIFGYKKVVLAFDIPDKKMDCHNVINITNHKCYEPVLASKLLEAGLEEDTYFIFGDDAYYISR